MTSCQECNSVKKSQRAPKIFWMWSFLKIWLGMLKFMSFLAHHFLQVLEYSEIVIEELTSNISNSLQLLQHFLQYFVIRMFIFSRRIFWNSLGPLKRIQDSWFSIGMRLLVLKYWIKKKILSQKCLSSPWFDWTENEFFDLSMFD